jgi:glycosyltransferase involved in cell wall biosynthesis
MIEEGGPRPWIFVIGGAQRGGAEGQFVRLAARLHRSGAPVECVFLFGGGPLLQELDRANVPWRVLRDVQQRSRVLRALSLALALTRLALLLRRRDPAVVMAWLTFATWPTLILSEFITSAARVAGIRGEILDSEVRWASRLLRRAFRKADAVVVNSDALTVEAASWGARADRIRLIPNGVDLPEQSSDLVNDSAVVVANYRAYKGHADLLRALALCKSTAQVRLCGAGDVRHLETLADELGVRERLHFVEHPADVPAELSNAGFAIHPSHTEGLSNAILEEMAAGLPVIAMSVGGNPMLIEDGVNGFLLDVGDDSALAQTIDQLATDFEMRKRLGTNSLEMVDSFTWKACAERYRELLATMDATSPRGQGR